MKTHYYISPQIWAWKESRISAIKRDIDKMYVILPFENNFEDKHHFPVAFVGHPLIDAIQNQPAIDATTFEEKISWIKTHNRHFTRKPKTRNYKNAFCNAKRC
jgi:lipid A disaccharide synthetase